MPDFKQYCGFRTKANVCSFPADKCDPYYCDFYNLPFTSKDIKQRIKEVDEQIKELKEGIEDKKTLEKVLKKQPDDTTDPDVKAYADKLLKMKDLAKGKEFLRKSLRIAKRMKL